MLFGPLCVLSTHLFSFLHQRLLGTVWLTANLLWKYLTLGWQGRWKNWEPDNQKLRCWWICSLLISCSWLPGVWYSTLCFLSINDQKSLWNKNKKEKIESHSCLKKLRLKGKSHLKDFTSHVCKETSMFTLSTRFVIWGPSILISASVERSWRGWAAHGASPLRRGWGRELLSLEKRGSKSWL